MATDPNGQRLELEPQRLRHDDGKRDVAGLELRPVAPCQRIQLQPERLGVELRRPLLVTNRDGDEVDPLCVDHAPALSAYGA